MTWDTGTMRPVLSGRMTMVSVVVRLSMVRALNDRSVATVSA
jgi:hypothetical protein